MFCKECGTQLPDGLSFCTNCGVKFEEQPTQAQQPAQVQQPAQAYQPYPAMTPPPVKKKGKGCLIAAIAFIAVIALIIAALFLLVPGLITPANLKVKPADSDYQSVMAKLGYTKDVSPTTGDADDYVNQYGPVHSVDTGITSKEATAFFRENRPPYYALKQMQFRFNPDGTIEASGKLDLNYVIDEILAGNVTKQEIEERLPIKLDILPKAINIYAHFDSRVIDNRMVGVALHSIKIHGISIPDSIIGGSEAEEYIENVFSDYLSRAFDKSGLYFEQLENVDGELVFKGIMPDSLTRVPVN